MRAVVVKQFGPVANLAIGELPKPEPGPNEVLIEIRATAVNFVDLLVIAGKYQFLPNLPFAPGKLPAGIVAAVGSDVRGLSLGDRVLAMAEHGGYAEFVAVREDQCYRLPPGLSFAEAASMSLVYDTAWFALRERARSRPGETALILGASGGVGRAAIQLAKAQGLRVLGAVSDPRKRDAVWEAGADALIDLATPNLRNDLRAQVFAANGGVGADIVVDPIGGDFFDAALRALAWRGRLVVVGFAAGRIPTVAVNYLLVKNIEVTGLQISDYRKRRTDLMAECMADIFALYRQGLVRPAPAELLPLESFEFALTRIETRAAPGRIVLVQGPQHAD